MDMMGLCFESCQVIEYYTHIISLKNGMLRWNEVQWQRKCRIWNGPRCSSPIPGMVELWNINGPMIDSMGKHTQILHRTYIQIH